MESEECYIYRIIKSVSDVLNISQNLRVLSVKISETLIWTS